MLRLVRDVEMLFAPPVTQPDPSRAPQPVPGDGRSVVISLSQQALWAFEGQRVVVGTYVSTGKPEFETPAGCFSVNLKLDVQWMGGFAKGKEFFYVPDVPYVMYFTEHDHALHGTYWHEKFGTPMSHGCVNLPIPVAEWLYGWAPMEMPVLVVE